MLTWFLLAWLVLFLFLVGICVGSFLNVCIARLPAGKSLFWPPSHCGACGTPIRSWDNVPLLSYWLLRGRCRACGAPFSMRYFWVELTAGLGFVLLFLLEIGLNIHRIHRFGDHVFWYLQAGRLPDRAIPFLGARLVTFSLLLLAYCCNLERQRVPLSITLTALLVAILIGVLCPWPWPDQPIAEPGSGPSRFGLQLCPFWEPLPPGLSAGTWLLGLVDVLAGALGGGMFAFLVRAFLLRSFREAIQHGDVSFCLLGGAFLGWQPILVAAILATAAALLLAVLTGKPRQRLGLLLSCLLGPCLLLAWLVPPGFGLTARKPLHPGSGAVTLKGEMPATEAKRIP